MPDLQTLFPDIGPDMAEQASRRFFRMDRESGDVVVQEGEVHDSMFIIESGQVKVHVGGFEVAELGPGACIGEIGLFTTSVRTATVVASSPVTFHLLSRKAFLDLEAEGNPVTAQIERRAIGQLGARLRQTVADIRIVAPNARSLLLEPVQSRQRDGRIVPLPVDAILASLKSMIAFEFSVPSVFPPLARLAKSRLFEREDTIAAVGRRDGPMQMLVSGRVDCLISLEADQVRAAQLSGGELFNILPFVDGQPRPMSYVAAEPCSVLTIERSDVRDLLAQAGPVAGALRKAMIRSLADRVNQANATYSLAKLMRLEVDSATPMPVPRRTVALPPEEPPAPGVLPTPAERLARMPRPAPVPRPTPVPVQRAAGARPPTSSSPTPPPVAASPIPAATPIPAAAPVPAAAPIPAPPPDLSDAAESDLPGFNPREFVAPAPLGLVRRTRSDLEAEQELAAGPDALEVEEDEEGTPWFDSNENDWDTWFELTEEVTI